MSFFNKSKKIYWFAAVLGVLIVSSLLPFELEIAPQRHFQIVDDHGQPLGSAVIRQIWDQYSLGQRGEIETKADNSGKVLLPARVIRTSVFSLLRGAVREIREVGIHGASFVSDDSVVILAEGFPPHIYFAGKGLRQGKAIIRKGPLDKTIIGSDR
jgi:hypothetical protein